MSTQYAPIFTRDGNDYIVPSPEYAQDTIALADAAGLAADLEPTYGLKYTGRTAVLDATAEGGYTGPFIIASVGEKTVWIVGGPTLDGLLQDRHPDVQNAPSPGTVTDAPAPDAAPSEMFGGGGGFDGAGAGGSI